MISYTLYFICCILIYWCCICFYRDSLYFDMVVAYGNEKMVSFHCLFIPPIAQLVEQPALNRWVLGSSPSGRTVRSGRITCAEVAELADAPVLGTGGGNPVEVQVLSSAQVILPLKMALSVSINQKLPLLYVDNLDWEG